MKEENTLTVADVLEARAEYDHVLEIRAVGPAVAIVLELQAPPRIHLLSSTRNEFEALLTEVELNAVWRDLIGAYFANENPLDSAGDHVARLEAGIALSTVRVSDRDDSCD